MKVAIIGGGIAGLTMAMALKRANIPFVIYEATKEIKPVGAGIAIANNAMQVYRHLGVADKLSDKGTRISNVLLTDFSLNVLDHTDLTPFEQQYRLANVAIHRSQLHQVLLSELDASDVLLNKRLEEITCNSEGLYQLTFKDGSQTIHEFIIGADGLRSQVRQFAFGEKPLRDAKQVCWRGVLDFDLPEKYRHVALEGWGRGKRFGFVKLEENVVYWYYLVNEDIYKEDAPLDSYLSGCDPMVRKMILNTSSASIFRDKIYDLPLLDEWYKDKVALIGDAAHASTPNLGQGACQAIEDVYVISKLLECYSLEESLAKFTAIRRPKAHMIVCESWKLGKVAQFSNPLLAGMRNTVFKMLPASLKKKQLVSMFELQKV
ncbi:MAG: FAD-dependent monooxygenase [Flavobacterium sp.]